MSEGVERTNQPAISDEGTFSVPTDEKWNQPLVPNDYFWRVKRGVLYTWEGNLEP